MGRQKGRNPMRYTLNDNTKHLRRAPSGARFDVSGTR